MFKMNADEDRHILEEVQGDFKARVDARAIARKARMANIIPEAVEKQINESKSSDEAKEILFEHLRDQAMPDGLRRFCSIMIESQGYQQMQTFGKKLLAKLEEVILRPGSSQVSSAAGSDVEVEGDIEQQRALGKAQRKMPPEDYAGHELKRQKDSDSAAPAVVEPLSSPQAEISHTAEVLMALDHQLDAQWRLFGTFLYVKSSVMDGISKDNSDVDTCILRLLDKWLGHENGTGDLPRTWQTLVQAVKHTGKGLLAEHLAKQHGLQLPRQ